MCVSPWHSACQIIYFQSLLQDLCYFSLINMSLKVTLEVAEEGSGGGGWTRTTPSSAWLGEWEALTAVSRSRPLGRGQELRGEDLVWKVTAALETT